MESQISVNPKLRDKCMVVKLGQTIAFLGFKKTYKSTQAKGVTTWMKALDEPTF